MATFEVRLTDFVTTDPPQGAEATVLCRDHCGTYALRFPCAWDGASWRNMATGEHLAAPVIGWRAWTAPARKRLWRA